MSSGVSPSTNRLVNVIVCVGAAVVIFGAWAKILHKSFADIMLTIGLLTEAAIFLVYAILPPPDAGAPAVAESNGSSMKSLDKMLENAEITPETINKLGAGFKHLGTSVEGLADMSNAVAATNEFSSKTKEATTAIIQVKDAYSSAAQSVGSFNSASESAKEYHDQVQILTKNLSSLNTIYELELQESNNHLKALNNFYGKLAEAGVAMQGSVEDAKRAHHETTDMANNLGKLNQIYGNMLSAMSGR